MRNSSVRFMSFSSGSCGNCYYLGNEDGAILIDAGVSLRRLKKVMGEHGLDMASLKAVLVTHDHLDHIRHLGSFCKKLSLPVYTTPMIHSALARHTFTSDWIASCRRDVCEGETVLVAGMSVKPFVVPHDATQTVGYSIGLTGHKFVIMTDVGRITDEAVQLASHADTVVLESNYDMDMLMGGPYTYELKMRIVQGCGHLSNDECACAVRRFMHEGLRNIFLCHLSDNNNTRELAYKCTLDSLRQCGVEPGTVSLVCLPRQVPSQLFNL
ncbi:MAG: MBL fold metallo-hydrolase [Bacteroidales bacterium]|nr:MBL fold metallo-hydrolase [Bacteroidales bacterium]MDD5910884.1 MBL fold metallo-hydrolase [Bacteroidales bacterium]